MKRNLFLDRHPLLHHLREHSREAAAAALSLIFVLWVFVMGCAVTRRLATLSNSG